MRLGLRTGIGRTRYNPSKTGGESGTQLKTNDASIKRFTRKQFVCPQQTQDPTK